MLDDFLGFLLSFFILYEAKRRKKLSDSVISYFVQSFLIEVLFLKIGRALFQQN